MLWVLIRIALRSDLAIVMSTHKLVTIYEPPHDKTNLKACVHSEDAQSVQCLRCVLNG